jgi:hypothetical protein
VLKTWYYLFSQTLGSCFNSVSFHTQVYASATRQRVNCAHAFIVSVILYWNWKNHHLIASINGRHLSLLLSHGNSCVHGKKKGSIWTIYYSICCYKYWNVFEFVFELVYNIQLFILLLLSQSIWDKSVSLIYCLC